MKHDVPKTNFCILHIIIPFQTCINGNGILISLFTFRHYLFMLSTLHSQIKIPDKKMWNYLCGIIYPLT